MSNEFHDDDLSDLLGGASVPRPTRTLPAGYTPIEQRLVTEACTKCDGSGRFRTYSGRDGGACFTCDGTGKLTFKNNAAARAKARTQAADRKAARGQAAVADWQAANPAEWLWLEATAPRWPLAQALLNAVAKWGSLTEKQMQVVRNGIARDAARTAAKAERVTPLTVEAAGVDHLQAAFDKAIAFSAEKGLKLSPRITIGGMTISPAKATSKNPGALYVKIKRPSFVKYLPGAEGPESTYLGKIVGGRFYPSRDCTPEKAADVAKFVANPAEAAKVYGQTTGTCCVCNATLRSEWKLRGIGPVCAEKFGW